MQRRGWPHPGDFERSDARVAVWAPRVCLGLCFLVVSRPIDDGSYAFQRDASFEGKAGPAFCCSGSCFKASGLFFCPRIKPKHHPKSLTEGPCPSPWLSLPRLPWLSAQVPQLSPLQVLPSAPAPSMSLPVSGSFFLPSASVWLTSSLPIWLGRGVASFPGAREQVRCPLCVPQSAVLLLLKPLPTGIAYTDFLLSASSGCKLRVDRAHFLTTAILIILE